MQLKFKFFAAIVPMVVVIALSYSPSIVIAQVDNSTETTNSDQGPEETFAHVQTRSTPETILYRNYPFFIMAGVVVSIAVVVFVLLKHRRKS